MRKDIGYLLAAAVLTCGAGCSEKSAPPAPAPAPAPAVTTGANAGAPVVPLLGRWNGPEGTFLLVEGEGANVALTVQNLDGPRRFEGKAAGGVITFQRDGKTLTIRPTSGAGTGMKWLAERKDCVVIEAGEGYCR